MFETEQFKSWLAGKCRVLWCPGARTYFLMFPVYTFSACVLSTRLYLSLFRVLYSVTVTLWLLVTLNAILVVLVERIWVGVC